MAKNLLVSWIGHNDLRPMAASQPPETKGEILEAIGGTPKDDGAGPIKTLVDCVEFDQIVLLSNFKAGWCRLYADWLGHDAKVKRVEIKNPTDYESIFQAADGELARLGETGLLKSHTLNLHLSPGSPAMAAVWLLLGKSKYPATFYQTYRGKAWKTEVPFDLVVDFLPDLYSDPDKHLQHLAAKSPSETAGFEQIIGDSPAIRTAVGRARRAAVRGVPVLLLGASGVGKEMFAQAIHKASPRSEKPFVAVNCAALPRDLLESELFGHVEGSFTGATDRKGAFAQADGGTLFLDEIGECDLELQAKLLRVLQPPSDGSPCRRLFRPVGASEESESDVRVLAATNRDLIRAIEEGRFREDLFYRLAVITVNIPSLQERRTDIPLLVESLMERINSQLAAEGEPGYEHKSISDSAMTFVTMHPWTGNVRQLQSVLLQAAVMSEGTTLERADLEAAIAETPAVGGSASDVLSQPLGDSFSIEQHLNGIQAHYLRRAMEQARGNKTEASRLLGMSNYQTLDAQLRRLNVTGDWG